MKKTFYTLSLVLFTALSAFAQTPVWSETFSGGALPAGWTTEDGSGQGFVWEYCATPVVAGSTCTNFYGAAAFASTSAADGFMILDSDNALTAALPADAVSRLTTSAIDCSMMTEVFIKFQSRIRTFTLNAADNAILRVSTDMTTWTDVSLFPQQTADNASSANPQVTIRNLSALAAGQSTVYLQWQWTNNWDYAWTLDDIELYDVNVLPAIDTRIGDFFFSPASYETPLSQMACDTMGFFALVSNDGSQAQPATLTAEILDGATVIFSGSVDSLIAVDSVDQVMEIPTTFVPDNLSEGTYTLRYTLTSANGPDGIPTNNTVSQDFVVGSDTFKKAPNATTGLQPGAGGDWSAGSFYRMCDDVPVGFNYVATDVQMEVAINAPATLDGKTATIFLLKLLIDINDFPASVTEFVDPEVFEIVGIANADFSGLGNFDLYTVGLEDFNTNTPGVVLEPGAQYFAMASYTGGELFHGFNSNYAYFNSVASPIFTTQWFLGGFADGGASSLNLVIAEVSSAKDQLPASAITLAPNPAEAFINVDFNFTTSTSVSINVLDINGRVIEARQIENAKTGTERFDTTNLPAGVYVAHVTTNEGTVSRQFSVIK